MERETRFNNPYWDIVLWNGYSNRLEMFRYDEIAAARLAEMHLESSDNVIYFFARIKSIALIEEM